jgi:hypothetical protein
MSERAQATFQVKVWEERAFSEVEGGSRLTRATVTKSFSGDIEGEAALEYLMMYRGDGSASFVGLERVIGRLRGRSGSFVLQHVGTFEGGTARARCSVVPGSGTGELRALRGAGDLAATHGEPYSLTLDYDFE